MITDQSADSIVPEMRATSIEAVSSAHAPSALPEEPLVKIRPHSPFTLNLREVWAHRELLHFLVWRDLKVRYKQTILGVSWVVLQPLLAMIIFTVFLGKVVRVPSDKAPYPVFAYAGLLLWTFFSNAVLSGSYSLVASAHVITKVYFPRMLIPVSAIVVRLIDFVIAFVFLIPLVIYYRIPAGRGLLLIPLLVVQLTALATAFGILFSALYVRYRDVSTVLPVLLQLWMFASPIIYPSSLLSPEWRRVYALNPLVGIVEGFRTSIFGGEFDWSALVISALMTLALLVYSVYVFQSMEEEFADFA
jgi:lipopolysaccharide transport system permease protein